eukprot:CAMPEP_0119339242 /NCGR_PEP_ID=MMETSP1333-20130426/97862_1 /TAXON_ID=418940 /ORGANISM="Scyphosphaera apsteinii, Strain RCC1455" /LENGTH=213 /DNA_ID=CAMNT_0007350733 /DNA_START=63 /DNA_END=704 /DNA_ORIENTATION=+
MSLGYTRPEGPEDISPPHLIAQPRSFESLSAAQDLSQLCSGDASACGGLNSSPSTQRAAATLQNVLAASTNEPDDAAIDCLMSLSSASSESKRKTSLLMAAPPATRRKLKMAEPQPPIIEPKPMLAAATGSETGDNVSLLSNATVLQLKHLAAAYKLCPSPSTKQFEAIATCTGLPDYRVQQWFENRKVLQDWVVQQPHMCAENIVDMFYGQN